MTHCNITNKAAWWLVELDTADNIEKRWLEFEAWRDENPEHHAEFLRVERTWSAVEELKAFHLDAGTLEMDPLLSAEPTPAAPRRAGHRSWTVAAAAIAAMLLIAPGIYHWVAVKGPTKTLEDWQHYATDTGDQKSATLPDGSTVHLNTDTDLRFTTSSDNREAVLDRGEALFAVAEDPRRPFTVHAGVANVRALGTTFSVWLKSQDETVTLVQEGQVNLNSTANPAAPSQVIHAQQAARVGRDGIHVRALSPQDLERKLAWLKRELSFHGEPLDEVVAEFNRYNREQLQIADPALAKHRISGTFPIDDPEGFALLLGQTLRIRNTSGRLDGSDVRVIRLGINPSSPER
jgi:transmembrane sensor